MNFKELADKVTIDLNLGNCFCGMYREPVRQIHGSLSLLMCAKCGKATTERKN